MTCPICAGDARPWGDVNGTPILRCVRASCRFRFFDLARWQSPYSRSDYYADWTPASLKPSAPWIQARVDIVRQFKSAGLVAELGCGIGETAVALADAGFSVIGVEESAKAVDFLKRHYSSVDWRDENISRFLTETARPLDAITLFHVLEHIPHPEKLVALVDRALRPDGVVVIEVPDAGGGWARLKGRRWDYFIDHHVNYFDTKSLGRLMEGFGFRRRFLQRTYHFSFPQGDRFKDLVKGTLARLGLNSIIRTAWTR